MSRQVSGSAAPVVASSDDVNDVLRRVVRAWAAAYEISHEAFALGIGMNQRTFARRLAGRGRMQAFAAGEVADIAAYMARMTGIDVSMGDLYDGRVLVGSAPHDPGPAAEGREWAPSGSNRRPTDYKSAFSGIAPARALGLVAA